MGKGHRSRSKDKTMEVTDGETEHKQNSSQDEGSRHVNGQPVIELTRSNSHVMDNDQPNGEHIPSASLGTDSLLQSGPRTHHSNMSAYLRDRPHSANIPLVFGRILRRIGDHYCYSPGIALRQMGDELSADYEVRRALSTGDIPSALKHSS